LTKLYFSWRDVACEAFERYARQLKVVDTEALETAKTAARVGCDAALVNLGRKFDAERKRHMADLVHNALHDSLTELPNRTLLVDRLEQLVAVSSRRRTGSAVLFIDLDRFKAVNDLAGHSVGDEFLAVGRRLQGVIRAGDTLARLGGDEFVILCPDLTDPVSEADSVAERINAVIAQPFILGSGDQPFFVSASVGVGIVGPHDSAEDLLSRADSAMYAAKRLGGNRRQTYDESADHSLRRRPELLNDLYRVEERGELYAYYQPVVELSSGVVTPWRHWLAGTTPASARFPPMSSSPWPRRAG
jgi:diguanylate cyclase (GGDEF)-like protein